MIHKLTDKLLIALLAIMSFHANEIYAQKSKTILISDVFNSSVFAKTKIDMRDEFTLYDTYTNKTGTSFTDTINKYLTSMRISAIDLNNNYGTLAYSTSTTVPNQEAWYASKLQSPKLVALQSRIDELTNTLSASSDSINDVTTRANLRKLDQALKQYRELLLK